MSDLICSRHDEIKQAVASLSMRLNVAILISVLALGENALKIFGVL
jgi:hypothetical protein